MARRKRDDNDPEWYTPEEIHSVLRSLQASGDLKGLLKRLSLAAQRFGRRNGLSRADCEDLVNDAIELLLAGNRRIHQRFDVLNNETFCEVLCGIIRSLAYNLGHRRRGFPPQDRDDQS